MSSLEDLLRDSATRGELVHFSIWFEPTKKRWCATYSPSHQFGVAREYADDPVTAAVKALEGIAHARKRKRSVIEENTHAREPASAKGADGENQNPERNSDSVSTAGA